MRMSEYGDTHDEVYAINLQFEVEPASVPSSWDRKAEFAKVVNEAVAKYGFLIVDDLRLIIDLALHEKAKYESDRKADIDNILKPLIDSLTGPAGLLVDDTMIQSVYCGWFDHL